MKAPVPSSTLLRFLRAQSEDVCFFNPSLRPAFAFDHAAPRSTHAKQSTFRKSPLTSTQVESISTAQSAVLEAGFPNLDFLVPRSTSSWLQPDSRVFRGARKRQRQTWDVGSSRYSSSDGRKWWQLWSKRAPKHSQPLHPDDLPGGEDRSDSMFSLGRRISAKAAAQPKLRCTELDENGNIILTSGEFKKSELIQKVRDLYMHDVET